MQRRLIICATVWGGAVSGTLDIAYALVFHGSRGASPIRILQSVASGLMGADAYNNGIASATLGLCLHYLIAIIFAAAFSVVAMRIRLLIRHAITAGLIYGFGIFWVMNLVVLPLSAFPGKVSFLPLPTFRGLVVHMLLVGLPIALLARRFASKPIAEPSATGNPRDAQ